MKSFIIVIVACLLHAAVVAPQLITFKDGKVGVNFLGYHAEAGLGGGQNSQNGLLGGLHASAGTPWGQNAAAGLGGSVNGRAAGVLYAGAQANPDIGASTVLAGDTSSGGFRASEAYVPGKVNVETHSVEFANRHRPHHHRHHDRKQEKDEEKEHHELILDTSVETTATATTEGANNVIQKVKTTHKKYRGDQAHIRKSVEKRQLIAPGSLDAEGHETSANVRDSSGRTVFSALQIPIGILQSLQQSLGGLP
ncbi:uncharacterized protein LOC106080750 isoform X1 [Stomoxys calcitrans]|uniref:uncharacterized protein LOC106080750 isoform X1 n=1 Tax=Stomoxys calcitrans TaxID=35570 RepID=UPI0027E2CB23|nr:uncharacterized protein LOC106080750 isoform X1 [Stomoxys calcitrans]